MPDQLKALLPEKISTNLSALQIAENQSADPLDSSAETGDRIDTQAAMDTAQQTEAPVAAETETTATDQPATVTDEAPAETKTQVASIAEFAETSIDSKQDSQNAPQSQEPYAQMLGVIKLKHNETLSRVIQRVYGRYNSKYFRSLILANPDIDDPDQVEIGQIIYLPAIPATVQSKEETVWWILIKEMDTLEGAYNFLRAYPDHAPPARLIPYWTRQSGIRFAVVLKEYFYDEASAEQHLRDMPAGLSPQGQVSSLWDEDTVYFADPFAGFKREYNPKLKSSEKYTPPFY
jgi:hypothetical protein